MALRYDFTSDVDDSTKQLALQGKLSTRLPLVTLPISVEDLTPDGSVWFHIVDAFSDVTKTKQRVIRLRVITNSHRGVNVTIPSSDILHQKYLDLRFQIRNMDYVMITFPELYVMGSPFHHELCLRAYDFKIKQ